MFPYNNIKYLPSFLIVICNSFVVPIHLRTSSLATFSIHGIFNTLLQKPLLFHFIIHLLKRHFYYSSVPLKWCVTFYRHLLHYPEILASTYLILFIHNVLLTSWDAHFLHNHIFRLLTVNILKFSVIVSPTASLCTL